MKANSNFLDRGHDEITGNLPTMPSMTNPKMWVLSCNYVPGMRYMQFM